MSAANNDQRLFVAVVLQAIEDAIASPSHMLRASAIKKARNWFERAGPDFREICGLAGLEPDQVQKKALAAIAANDNGVKVQRTVEKAEPAISVRTYLYKGTPHTLSELAAISGLSAGTIKDRINRAWSIEDAVNTPKLKSGAKWRYGPARRPAKRYDYEGRKITITEMAAHCDLTTVAIHHRLKAGWSIERIMTTPAMRRTERNKAYYDALRSGT